MESSDDPPLGGTRGHARSSNHSHSGSDSDNGRAPIVTFADPSAAYLHGHGEPIAPALGGGPRGSAPTAAEPSRQRRRRWLGERVLSDRLGASVPTPLEPSASAPVHSAARGSMWARSIPTLPLPDAAQGESPARPASIGGPRAQASSDESSDDESRASPELEDQWLRRARTFSVSEALGQAGSQASLRQMHGSTHTFPRVATVGSALAKEYGDQPPIRLGYGTADDLGDIRHTSDERSDSNQPENDLLKHLVQSKYNYRALVTYAGYLLPINILLNVMLLGRGWLQLATADPDGTHRRVNNPAGYLVTSIVSLILIVASGLCFILRCLEFDVLTTTAITVSANFVNAALILVSAVVYVKSERPKHPDARLTGEYYCSYAGAAVALLNAVLLLADIVVTPGFRYRGSGMSRPQRMLQFNLIVVVVWIGIGGFVWSKIESWDIITSVMFCMITVTTIGYGNISPTKTYSRILQLIYGPLGILMFGMMLLNTRNVILQITRDTFRVARRDFEARRVKIRQDLAAAHVRRRLAVRPERRGLHGMLTDMMGHIFLSRSERTHVGIPRWLRRSIDADDDGNDAGGASPTDLEASMPVASEGGNITFAEPGAREPSVRGQSDVASPDDAPLPMDRTYTTASRLSQVREVLTRVSKQQGVRQRLGLKQRRKSAASDADGATDDEDSGLRDAAGVDEERIFHSGDGSDEDRAAPAYAPGGRARSRAKGSERTPRKTRERRDLGKQLWAALALNIAFWLASAGVFYVLERPRWSYFDAMWYCYVTFTTIGYGDLVPKSTEGMVVFICLCFVAVGLETFLVVSGVSLCTEKLSQLMKRTRVQKRIARHKTGLAAYEIRRHIKHPDYNPFGRGDDEGVLATARGRLRRVLRHLGEVLRGKRPVGDALTRHLTRDQRERDELITAGFIRHTTGMGGFADAAWQPPSPPASRLSGIS
ncbi:Potassium channel [Coemansia nantahalensis]|nr:Potassium channel [Coemansia nantahalensis]